VKTLLILGDLTDAKDNHPAELVNRVVQQIQSIGVSNIRILCGNHDWLRRGHEFFKFLNVLPGVEFITTPREESDTKGPSAYFLPYSKDPAQDWRGLDFSHYDFLFMHQTVSGARASNGQLMEGERLPALNAAKVYSGDIHVPQIIGEVEYVGSPYHVHFGDSFKPRCILLDRDARAHDLHFQTVRRTVLSVTGVADVRAAGLKAGDQVKLRVELHERDKHTWSSIRRDCVAELRRREVVVQGVELVVRKARRVLRAGQNTNPAASAADIMLEFVRAEDLPADVLDIGLELVKL
jgi:hypothetical protein